MILLNEIFVTNKDEFLYSNYGPKYFDFNDDEYEPSIDVIENVICSLDNKKNVMDNSLSKLKKKLNITIEEKDMIDFIKEQII
jgi:hypothetical protein